MGANEVIEYLVKDCDDIGIGLTADEQEAFQIAKEWNGSVYKVVTLISTIEYPATETKVITTIRSEQRLH